MMSTDRTCLDAMMVWICQCLRSWFRAGIIDNLDPLLHELETTTTPIVVSEGAEILSRWLVEPREEGIWDSDKDVIEVGSDVKLY
ncbi:hypothetical protein F4680DRAFT_410957 [Xylaria scruposa]|nr:hypothetical protein F4680DRAFT_410957 [Xylaria scruposa]